MLLLQCLDNDTRPFIATKVFLTRQSAAQYAIDVLYTPYVGEDPEDQDYLDEESRNASRSVIYDSLVKNGEFKMSLDGYSEEQTLMEIIDVGEPV